MKISKITKILPLALALSIYGCAFADEEVPEQVSKSAIVNYTIDLQDYIRITTTTPNLTSTTKFGNDYKYININSDMTGIFNVISNAKTRTMELTAEKVNGQSPLYGVTFDGNTGAAKLIFTHSTEIPAGSALEDIIAGASDPNNNANAIGFNVVLGQTYKDGPGSISGAWDNTNKKITYTMNNGVSDITVKVGGKNIDHTFNTQDQSGTYKAVLTLTDVGPVVANAGGEPAGD